MGSHVRVFAAGTVFFDGDITDISLLASGTLRLNNLRNFTQSPITIPGSSAVASVEREAVDRVITRIDPNHFETTAGGVLTAVEEFRGDLHSVYSGDLISSAEFRELFPNGIIRTGYQVTSSGDLYRWPAAETGDVTNQRNSYRVGGGNTAQGQQWELVVQGGSRLHPDVVLNFDYSGLRFAGEIQNFAEEGINVSATATTISYPITFGVQDMDWIVAEFPGQGLVFYRVQVATGNIITNHQFHTLAAQGGTFTIRNASYPRIRFARIRNPQVAQGWLGIISGRGEDADGNDTFNNNGVNARVYRETTGAEGDRWEIQTDYAGVATTGDAGFRTIIARR